MEIGDRIRNARKALGLSQAELAEKTGYKSRSAIAKIESGVLDISQSQVYEFAEVLMVTPQYLMGFETQNDDSYDSDPEFGLLARNFKNLTDEQKSAIIALLESFNKK